MGLLRRLWHEITADGVGDLAAGLSYRFLFALFPFAIFLSALSAVVVEPLGLDNPASSILDQAATTLPADARSVIERQLAEVIARPQPGILSAGIAAALWAAAGGMGAVMRAMNRAYGVEETRPFWKRTAVALALTFGAGSAIVIASILAVGGNALGMSVARAIGAEDAYAALVLAFRFVAVAALLIGAAALLYWAAPDAKLPFRWISPGATAFVLVWSLTASAFAWYVSNFGSYNATYGALGALIIMMLWFYISAFVLLAGAELNAVLAAASIQAAGEPGPREAHPDGQSVAPVRHAPAREDPWPRHATATEPRRGHAWAGAIVGLLMVWRATRPRRPRRRAPLAQ